MTVQLPPRNVAEISKTSNKQHHETNPALLEKQWNIGLETATNTIKVTIHKGGLSIAHPLYCMCCTKQQRMRYNTFNFTMHSDTIFDSKKSIRGHTMSQVFVTNRDYAGVGHMSVKSESEDTLLQIFQSVGVTQHMVTDGAKKLTQGTWGKLIKEYQVNQTIAKPHIQYQKRLKLRFGGRENVNGSCSVVEHLQSYGTSV